jgi:hypothetical protein
MSKRTSSQIDVFQVAAVHHRVSSTAKNALVFDLHPYKDALAIYDQPDYKGSAIVVRVEYAFDPVFARRMQMSSNIGRKFAVIKNPEDFITSITFPCSGISIHEMIPPQRQVKLWFDLDNFSHELSFLSVIDFFEVYFANYMLMIHNVKILEDDYNWCSSTKYDVNPFTGQKVVLKNSLHLTVDGFTVPDNACMKTIASGFVQYLTNTKMDKVPQEDFIKHALIEKGVIDLQVYKDWASLRVAGSAKLSDPERYMEMVSDHHCGNLRASYITCFFRDDCQAINVSSPVQKYGVEVPLVQTIVTAALALPTAEVVISTSPSKTLPPWMFIAHVKNYRHCATLGGNHSHDRDVYFVVNLFSPIVIQRCHSAKCADETHEGGYEHKEGFFRPLALSTRADPIVVNDYVVEFNRWLKRYEDADAAEHEEEKAKERKSAAKATKEKIEEFLLDFKRILFVHYYNRFFCAIVDERCFIIGVRYFMESVGEAGRRTAKEIDFLKQRMTLRYIKDWVESPHRAERQHLTFVPWDETMIEVIHADEAKCKADHFTPTVHYPSVKPFDTLDESRDFNKFCGLKISHQDALDYDGGYGCLRPFFEHILHVWCGGNKDLNTWVIKWLAHIYLRPWEPMKSCIVLQGDKGAGKGIILSIFAKLIGERYYWQVGDLNNLTGTYTHPKFMTAVAALVDEAFWGGDPRSANALKNVITEERQDINIKYEVQRSFTKYMNVVIASNNRKIIEYTKDNRRFQFLTLITRNFADAMEKKIHFDTLANTDPLALAAFFVRRVCLCDFDPQQMFLTAGSTEQLIASLKPLEQWWYNTLCKADDEIFLAPHVLTAYLRDDMITYTKTNGIRFPQVETARAFSVALKKMCKSIPKAHRVSTSPITRKYAFKMPEIETAREDFNEYLGRPIKYSL